MLSFSHSTPKSFSSGLLLSHSPPSLMFGIALTHVQDPFILLNAVKVWIPRRVPGSCRDADLLVLLVQLCNAAGPTLIKTTTSAYFDQERLMTILRSVRATFPVPRKEGIRSSVPPGFVPCCMQSQGRHSQVQGTPEAPRYGLARSRPLQQPP